MMRSMYSGVAGLKTHQTKMDVIGNNIANVNTVAYKSQSVTFSELMYQTTQKASGANALTGTAGINARQIGLGVKTGAINTAIATEGASQTTNNPFDIRITGDAFFIVSNGLDTFFTRDGSFYVDGQGNLAMTSNGYNVMGWQVDPTTNEIRQDDVSALRVMSPDNMTYPPEATSQGYVSGILDKNDTDVTSSSGKVVNLQFYDNLGYSYTAKMVMKSTNVEGQYTVEVESILDSNNDPIDIEGLDFGSGNLIERQTKVSFTPNKIPGYKWSDDGKELIYVDSDNNETIKFSATKATPSDEDIKELIMAYGLNEGDTVTAKEINYFKSLAVKTEAGDVAIMDILGDVGTARADAGIDLVKNPNQLSDLTADIVLANDTAMLSYDATTGKFLRVGDGNAITIGLSGISEKFSDISVDFSSTTMFNNSGSSTLAATNGDKNGLGSGRKIGQMSGISISDDGRIYASYDNGQSKLLGQIAVAQFSNASGLEKEGDNLYRATQNSGDFDGIGVDVKADGGYMTTGVLEMSNVDLSAEFTEMITTQRGFQANSRIITVSDTLLEELVNLKR